MRGFHEFVLQACRVSIKVGSRFGVFRDSWLKSLSLDLTGLGLGFFLGLRGFMALELGFRSYRIGFRASFWD